MKIQMHTTLIETVTLWFHRCNQNSDKNSWKVILNFFYFGKIMFCFLGFSNRWLRWNTDQLFEYSKNYRYDELSFDWNLTVTFKNDWTSRQDYTIIRNTRRNFNHTQYKYDLLEIYLWTIHSYQRQGGAISRFMKITVSIVWNFGRRPKYEVNLYHATVSTHLTFGVSRSR